MRKKLLALCCILTFLICLLPAGAIAEGPSRSRRGPPGRTAEYDCPYDCEGCDGSAYGWQDFEDFWGEETPDMFDGSADSYDYGWPEDGSDAYDYGWPEDNSDAYGYDWPEGDEAYGYGEATEQDDTVPVPPPEQTEEELAAARALADQIEPDGPVDTEPGIRQLVVTVAEGETRYAAAGETVFNNGGTVFCNFATVYNNGGVVFNNGGEVYNNAGTVYNNGGTVWSNGGEVFHNSGTVFSNNATVHSFEDLMEEVLPEKEEESLPPEAEEMLPEDLEEPVPEEPEEMLPEETAVPDVEASPVPGEGEDILAPTGEQTAAVTRAEQPTFNLRSGRYSERQIVTISGPEDCEIWYSTDGQIPEAGNAILYSDPIEVEQSCVLTAIAVRAGAEQSDPVRITLRIVPMVTDQA